MIKRKGKQEEEKEGGSKTSGSGPQDRKRWFRDAGQRRWRVGKKVAGGWVVLCRPWDKL